MGHNPPPPRHLRVEGSMAEPTPRPPSTNDRVSSVKNVNDGVRGILGVAADMFADRPGFIAGNGGGWPLADAVRSVSQFNCRQWARSDKSGFSARVNAGNSSLCTPYLSSIGMAPPEGDFSAPFVGGQCAVVYNVPVWVRQVDGSEGLVTYLPALGPIQSITRTRVSDNVYRFDVVGATGGVSSTTQPNLSFGAEPRSGFYDPEGTPNDCGDPPAFYTPPGSSTGGPSPDDNISIDIPGIGPITVTVTPNSNGDPVVCYDEVDLCVTIPVGGDDGPPVLAPPPPGPPGGTAGTSGDTGSGGDEEGEAPENEELVGLRLNLLSVPPNAPQYSDGLYRAPCYVFMGNENGLDLDPAGAALRDGQLVLAERPRLTKWLVSANVGFNIRVTPYYRIIEL